ncbi:NADP-dependent oxidoreductase [Cryobacterium psychrophilum]|uniref:NADP-dependent oxidoreductase n=1 Tax=Cryobacterium psychrophilum TaxID=41988 RepID=A0A4Y8KV83_9MICO|nr:NADP-dependent oxidoreductase [Cryobacterium psychrophilum]TDW29263.1 NADPH:quinone reductase-like Zn-dependent oxidoreductase [Cryobacterium psychrophilum]TFD79943.1 NADP-dependent oxidoreductase [Cryobacterium psychrophilum]
MSRAVTFSRYGGPEVLEIVEVPIPVPGPGEVVVAVMSAGLNPIDTSIREGRLQKQWPLSLPAGHGGDFAGFIYRLGEGVVGWKVKDAVLGHTVHGAQAEFVLVPAGNVIRKPEGLSWEIAGSLFVAAASAWAAVQGANPGPGRTVLVHAAAGGVGIIAAQLAKRRGATVIGTASPESFDRLRQLGVVPVEYGPGLQDELRRVAPRGVDAELEHDCDPTIATVDSTNNAALTRIAQLIEDRQITVPVAAIYPLDDVAVAYRELEAGHAHGKIVLSMVPVAYTRQKVHGIDIRYSEATRDAPDRKQGPPTREVLPPVFGHRHHPAPLITVG